jgi:hypothetical protein
VTITTTATGAYTGSLVTGTKTVPLKGTLTADLAAPGVANLSQLVTAKGMTPVKLELTLNGDDNSLSGAVSVESGDSAAVEGWRNVSASMPGFADAVIGTYHFAAPGATDDPTLPAGYTFGSLAVDKKANVTVSGELADGSALSGSTFVGPKGEVLIYVPLYGGRGSVLGVVKLTQGNTPPTDNTVTGTLDWYKPAPDPKAKDTLYSAGFGPLTLTVDGGPYLPPTGSDLVLGLSPGENNAQLSFSLGGLDETSQFAQPVTISSPKAGANAGTVTAPVNDVKITKFSAAAGTMEGEFTIDGRKATFSLEIVNTTAGAMGLGYFVLPQAPESGTAPASTPKLSGTVVLSAPPVATP